MDDRNVREQQPEENDAAYRPEPSVASESQQEGGSSFGTQNRPQVPPEGWAPVVKASKVAVARRMSREAPGARAERVQLPGIRPIGRHLLRRDDLRLRIEDDRPQTTPEDETKLSLRDAPATVEAADREWFEW
jgi:hypothetical protein